MNEFVTLEPGISAGEAAKNGTDERDDGLVDALSVFVYGTLKPGGRYYPSYCAQYSPEAAPALVRGKLYDFPQLGYPAMTVGEDWVQGYVLSFFQPDSVCSTILKRLDALEGYRPKRPTVVDYSDADDEYIRTQIQTFLPSKQPFKRVWGYVMAEEKVHRLNGVYLPDGCWQV